MKIDKLHLLDFGKFHNKDIVLDEGINVVYGANEAGKTTIKDFIVDMFYGIDKSRGIGARFDHYEQKKPINGAAFAGAMEVSTEDNNYLIERNFIRQDKKTVVRELVSGREVTLQEPNSLMGTLLHTDKSTYVNTLCVNQMSSATDKEIADKLNHYIVNMASTRTGEIDAVSAIMELKNKKKTFQNKDLEIKEQELTAQLALERDFDAELAGVREEYAAVEAAMQGKAPEQLQFTPIKPNTEETEEESLDAEATKKEESQTKAEDVEEAAEEVLDKKAAKKAAKEAKKAAKLAKKNATLEDEFELDEEEEKEETTSISEREKQIQELQNMGEKSFLDNVFVILFLSLLCMALVIGIAYVVPVNVPEVKMGIMGFGIALIVITTIQILVKRAKLHKLLEELEIEQGFAVAKEEMQENTKESVKEEKTVTLSEEQQREFVNRLSDLKVKEEKILNDRTNQEQILNELTKLREQKAVNDVEVAALDLAIKTIEDLSEEIYDSFGSVLNEQVSEIISRITNNKYSEVKIDDQLRVMVKSGSSFISMDYLSAGTVEQIYLALRLSIANVLVEEDLPIIIDDSFVSYDYQRLQETLSCLGEYLNRQIIIFTANPGIQDMFAGLGIQSNYIAI